LPAKARAGEKVVVWPSILGGKNWEPMSFDPQNNTAYINTLNFGGHYKAVAADYKAGEWYVGMDLSDLWEWPQGPRGYLKAIDPLTGKTKWEDGSDIPCFSGVLSTGGGLVFSGRLTGEFEAFDADSGKKLWQFQTGSGIEGQPVGTVCSMWPSPAAMAACTRCSPATSGWLRCRPADRSGCSHSLRNET
jgi:alcohol dehydrogenase (cytochrome c)